MRSAPYPYRETANDRFKRSFGRLFWASLILAALSHFALFQFFPTLEAEDVRAETRVPTPLLPPILDVPPPPPHIDRPAPPVPSDLDITEVTPPTTLDANPVPLVAPPAADRAERATDFVPYTLKPELRAVADALAIVESEYPPRAQQAGISGTVMVRARVDTLGRVLEADVVESSGVPMLDEAAVAAVLRFEFTPALNRDRKVSVWVLQKVAFRSR